MAKNKERPLIAVNMIRMRGERDWTQLDLAEKANLHVNVIKKIETGISQGWPKTRERIAKAFGCSVDDLTQRYAAQSTIIGQSLNNAQTSELIEQLRAVIRNYESLPPPKPKK